VAGTEHPLAGSQGLLVQLQRAWQIAEGSEGLGQVAHGDQGPWMIIADHPSAGGQGLFEQVAGTLQVAEGAAGEGGLFIAMRVE
jgi:hypothetical protein